MLADGHLARPVEQALRFLCDRGESIPTAQATFAAAYRYLLSDYRNEYVFKNTLANKLVFGRHSPATASLLNEFRVNDSIADTVVINGTSTVYEIKTEYDTLVRLPAQLNDYSKIFDKVYVVTHERAVSAVKAMAFPHVGILLLTGRGTLQVRREASSNIPNLDLRILFMSLRKSEFTRILLRHKLLPDVGATKFWAACQQQFAKLPREVAHAEAIFELRLRTTGAERVEFLRQLPPCLRLLGFAEPFSRPKRRTLLENLQSPLAGLHRLSIA
jgi:hypothetical protein